MVASFGQMAVLALGAVATLVEAGTQSHGPRRLPVQPRHQNIRKAVASQPEQQASLEKRQSFTGKGSFYNAETGNQGACGGFIKNSDWTVALNTDQFDGVRPDITRVA